jgi:hypothetical protein
MPRHGDFDLCVRETWRDLVGTVLPHAARRRGWAIDAPAAFRRTILDAVCGGPWEETARRTGIGIVELVLAIEFGERMLAGQVDVAELSRRSIRARAAPLDERDLAELLVEAGAEEDECAARAALEAADRLGALCMGAGRARGERRR